MNRISFYLSALFLLTIAACSQKDVPSWAQWRGPNGDGIATDSLWDWNRLETSNILWRTNVGFGHSAISVVGNKCFAAGWTEQVTETDTVGTTTLYCLDVQTGNPIWSYKYTSEKRSFPGPRSTPVIDGRRVFFLDSEGLLTCLDLKDGEENWQINLALDSLTVIDQWGYCPSPVIHNNLILLNLNKRGIAINKRNGTIEWNSEPGVANFASVKLIDFNNQKAAVFAADTTIYILDPKNGNLLSSYKKEKVYTMHNDVMPLGENQLFTSDELLILNDRKIQKKWKNDTISSYFQTGVAIGEYAYQFSIHRNKSRLYCIDLKNGQPKWHNDMGKWGTILGTKDKLIIMSGLGKVTIAEANPNEYKPLKELQVFDSEDVEENWCWTMPTLVNQQLFVRNSKGEVACIQL